jgi:hypothetical protein
MQSRPRLVVVAGHIVHHPLRPIVLPGRRQETFHNYPPNVAPLTGSASSARCRYGCVISGRISQRPYVLQGQGVSIETVRKSLRLVASWGPYRAGISRIAVLREVGHRKP